MKRNVTRRYYLFVCLLPDALIDYFTKSYSLESSEAENLARFIIKRRDKLRNIVENIPSFISYKESKEAQEDIISYVDYLKSFKTTGRYLLLEGIKTYWCIDIKENIFLENIKGYSFIINSYKEFDADIPLIEMIFGGDNLNKILTISSELKIIINRYLDCPSEENRIYLYKSLLDAKLSFIQLGLNENGLFFSNIVNMICGLDNILSEKSELYKEQLNKISNEISFSLSNEKKRSLSPIVQSKDESNQFGFKRPRT